MKRRLILISVLSIGAATPLAPSWGQWIQTSGPGGGNILALGAEPGGVNRFAGTFYGGVYRTTDDGAHWCLATHGLPYATINTFAFCGGNVYAGTSAGVYRSSNGGTSWSEASTGLTNNDIHAITACGTNLFAGTYGGGVFRSTDNGGTWTAVNAGMEGIYPYACFVEALAVNGTSLSVGTGSGVFRSTDSGTNWTAVNSGLSNTNVQAIAVLGTDLFAKTNDGVYRSTDNGTLWTPVNYGIEDKAVRAFAVSGTKLFAGTASNGVYCSTDRGETWVAVNNGLTYTDVRAISARGKTILAGNFEGGVYRSTDCGDSWSEANTGLANTRVGALAVIDMDLFAGTIGGEIRGDLFISTDAGTLWSLVGTSLTDADITALAVRGSELFVGSTRGLFHTTDRGGSWQRIDEGLVYSGSLSSLLVAGESLYAGFDGNGVFLSTNTGATWTDVSTGLDETIFSIFVTDLAASGNSLFAATLGGVYRSTNGGSNWYPETQGIGRLSVYALMVSGTDLYAGTENGGVFRSTNDGTTWTQVNTGLSNLQVHALEASGTYIFAGTWGDGVFTSDDHGASWHAINSGWEDARIEALAVSGTDLIAGTYAGGVWRRPLSEVLPIQMASFRAECAGTNRVLLRWSTLGEKNNYGFQVQKAGSSHDYQPVPGAWIPGQGSTAAPHDYAWTDTAAAPGIYYRLEQIDLDGTVHYSDGVQADQATDVPAENTPACFSLEQNYPNPFNPSTTIRYALPLRAHVTLSLFNCLGQEVVRIVNGEQEAGYQIVRFDGSGIASGVYFYRLRAGDFVQTRKLVLLH